MSKAKLERLEKIIGRKDNIPMILWPDNNGLYNVKGILYTLEELRNHEKKYLFVIYK